jgi:glycosyltransferase involved in cell wall biosynthesis
MVFYTKTGCIHDGDAPMPCATDTLPLVSCIMPTCNRRRFVSQAIRYFLRQQYEPKELIIVDDGDEPVEDLVPADNRIRLIRLAERTRLGAKRNLACEAARGACILHWDDDDWMADWRITYQVEQLLQLRADICGLRRVLFFNPVVTTAWEYVFPGTIKPWVYGASLCYTAAYWRENRFAHVDVGEDTRFIWNDPDTRIVMLDDNRWLAALIHPGNTSPKRPEEKGWHPYSFAALQDLIGEDWCFYDQLTSAQGNRPR